MKLFYIFIISLICTMQVAFCQSVTKPLKVTFFRSIEVEVEADVIKTSLVSQVNHIEVLNREYTIVEGNAKLLKMGEYDIVEFHDQADVKVQVVVSDSRYGCDTAYLKCRAGAQSIDVSSKFYMNSDEWYRVTNKFSAPISKREYMAYVERDDKLPNVLLIGTSISMGYTVPVREQLNGVANIYRIPSNSNSTEISLAKIDFWLGDMKWDVIHANWGLHDLKYTLSDREQDVPPAKYKANLRRLFSKLVATGAKVIWANTSYVPEGCKPRRDVGDDVLYNNIALEVLKEFPQIVVDDQYTLTKDNPKLQMPHNVHFTDEGYDLQAQQVVGYINKALE